MPRVICLGAVLLAGLAAVLLVQNPSDTAAKPDDKPRKASGLDRRVPWTTSNVRGAPEPPSPYVLVNAFPGVKFDNPLDLAAVPGTKRLAVAQQHGKVFTFENKPDATAKHQLLALKSNVYGLAFHPKYAENGYVFVSTIRNFDKPDGTQIVRFKVKQTDPPEVDPASETVVFTWPPGGHNGGCIRFGNDGYLYIATGDGSGIADQLETGQRIDDLLASILRIDVDHPDAGKNYGIPKDNPFVETKGARPEVYAYGLRQPWRFDFDRPTGDLWAADVGQDLWEMVYRIEKGGNYGWSVTEGNHPFRPTRKHGPTPILPAVVEHNHHEFRSITGGLVYHGARLPNLTGFYVYGDYDTGRVWAFKYDAKARKAVENFELVDTQLRIAAWGMDADGELYAVDHQGGGLHKIVPYVPPAGPPAAVFPRKLSQTGLFASTKDHTPAAGVIPYSVNAELWSDGATKQRFMAIPGDAKIVYEAMTYPQPAPGAHPGWRFPDGTVFVKTFSLGGKRVETRLLVGERVLGNEDVGDQVWLGYTYRWNDDQTDADLVEKQGLDKKSTVGDREQTWHFPSRTECTLCHTMSAKYVLGMNTLQANRDHDYGDCVANQLATFDHIGLFTKPLPNPPEKLAKLVDYHDAGQPLDARARSYLHANCSHCHRKWGGGNADFQLLFPLALKDTGIANVKPGHGDFEVKDARLLVPGDPDKSLIYLRMNRLGLGRMPHVASTVIDDEGAKIVRDWIGGLAK
jgi:uncharacterized repeat protein (TIGR03806 family)